MKIRLDNLSKKFNRELVFTDLSYEFESGISYALIGSNGSGKSTLLQIIAGYMLPSGGRITYHAKARVSVEDIYAHVSLATPYMELIEEFTLTELLNFHFKFKPLLKGHSIRQLTEIMYLEDAADKQVKYFSSGMKQRLKLGLAFFTDSPIVLLDEPTSNLDIQGIDWYKEQLNKLKGRLLIIASNQGYEYETCQEHLHLHDYKR